MTRHAWGLAEESLEEDCYGRYLISVISTMGPGIRIDTSRQTAGEILVAAGVIEEAEQADEVLEGAGA